MRTSDARARLRVVASVTVAGLAGLAYSCAPVGEMAVRDEGIEGQRVSGGLPVLPDLSSAAVRAAAAPLSTHLQDDPLNTDPVLSPEQIDDLLISPVLRDADFARAVHGWIDYWTGPAARWFPGFLERMAWLGSTVDSALVVHGLPQSMRYLPLIESGYDPGVTSRASAVGLWQLMPPTARELGLEVTPLLDERRDPERSTEAALVFLASLHEEFGSWHFALAAYNGGPARARRILRRHAPGEQATDSLFWALRSYFPRETREFVPKLYGAMWVASHPEAYGFEVPSVEPWSYDLVHVPDQTTLDVVALAAGAEWEEVIRLNPEYLRGITPPGRASRVRVPAGRGRTFDRIYPRIVPNDRVSFATHEVRAGETLSVIAGQYGLSVDEIEALNPRVRPRSLGVGSTLVVPVLPR
jgi:membrane-bound lytic murein transglycosylase D